MSKWRLRSAVGLLLTILLAGCTSGNTSSTTGPTGDTAGGEPTTTSTTAPPAVLVVWTDDTRAPVVEQAGKAFTTATGASVKVEVIPFRQIRDDVLAGVVSGGGPDIFIDSNEGTGELVEAGAVAPLDLAGRESDFYPVTLDAFRYGGDLFAVPFAFEAIGLIYNKALVADAPADFDALKGICDRLGYPAEPGRPCLAIPAGDPLHQFPFLSAFGGYLFGSTGGGYDVGDVGLDSDGAIAGAQFLDSLYRDAYADGTVDYGTMADGFNEGRVPFMWTGPWQLSAVQAAGIDYGVAKLPLMDGNAPRPFAGAQGFFVSSSSPYQDLARTFLLDHISTTESMLKLFEVTDRAPALRSAADRVAADAPAMESFIASGLDGVPLPNVPDMDLVWSRLVQAIATIDAGSYGEPYTDVDGNPGTTPPDPAGVLRETAAAVRQVFAPGA